MSNKMRCFSNKLAKIVNELEFQIVENKLKKQDLIADVDDQRLHHFPFY